jgi:hypothetical protein
MGLLEEREGSYFATAAIEPLVAEGFSGIQRALFAGWRDDTAWYESAGYEGMYWSSGRPAARKRILQCLAAAIPGTWYETTELAAYLRRVDPFFMRPRHEIIRYRGTRAVQDAMESWDQVEGRLIRTILEGPLRWLGVLALPAEAGTPCDRWSLTPLGAWLLDLGEPSAEIASARPIVVQPTFEITIVAPTARHVHVLNTIADLTHPDVAPRYELTRESIFRALAAGWTVERVEELLETGSGRPLPQNVAYTIREWASKFRTADIRPALLVEFDSAAGLDEWLPTADAAVIGARRIAPTLLELPVDTSPRQIERLLREHGVRPRGQQVMR